jgi:hypothetical protein
MDAKLSEHRHTFLGFEARSGSTDVYAKIIRVGEAKVLCCRENSVVSMT